MNEIEITRPSWDNEPLPLVAGEAYAKVCGENRDLNRLVAVFKVTTGMAFVLGFLMGVMLCISH